MSLNPIFVKIFKISFVIISVVIIGSFGYWKIENYGLVDAVYMTVITLTTTGFQEVKPLSSNGKIFTVFLLLAGVGVVTYSISNIVTYLTSIDFSKRRRDKMEKRINLFKGHSIVCGIGNIEKIFNGRVDN